MKVYMSKYPRYGTAYSDKYYHKKALEYKKKHGVYPAKEEHLVGRVKTIHKFLEKIDDHSVMFFKMFERGERKIKVRIDDHDVWAADMNIAMIVYPILLKLKEVKHGSPYVDDIDVPEYLRDGYTISDAHMHDDAKTHEKWDWVIDEMIFAFGCMSRDWEDDFYSDDFDVDENFKRSAGTFDSEGQKKAWERINNGLRLFAKYYHGLSD